MKMNEKYFDAVHSKKGSNQGNFIDAFIEKDHVLYFEQHHYDVKHLANNPNNLKHSNPLLTKPQS